ncbi:MAG TPA: phospho-N-acetylmuramoyl-pentapeptide-transferase [Acidimicrobiales bacterium]|nr:phospho-N-acetylmuramoyl-pentapeptide-transferase [Acidimicrobiales bacterium]
MIALLLAAGFALIVSLVGTPFLISWLRAHGLGQPIREEGPQTHLTKAGTPTMGGLMIVIGAVVGYVGAHLRDGAVFTWGGMLTMAAIIGAGAVGLLDDYIKVRDRKGISGKTKMAGLLVVAVLFAWGVLVKADVSTMLSFTRLDSLDLDLGPILWVVLAIVLFTGFTNAVNLTDGLDGLAAGSGSFSYTAYVVIAFWAFRHPEVYDIPQALDLALVAAAMVGACAGFLWWNAAPAQIIMGDTGSLAIGAGLAALALVTNTHLLLPIIGGIYVIETVSVMLQVATFRLLKRRVFRMAPVHHHFELLGWPETTIIIRFWILAAMATAMAVGIFYADYLSIPGVID